VDGPPKGPRDGAATPGEEVMPRFSGQAAAKTAPPEKGSAGAKNDRASRPKKRVPITSKDSADAGGVYSSKGGKPGKMNGGERHKKPRSYRRNDYLKMSHEERLKGAIDRILAFDRKIRPLNSNANPGGLVEFCPDDPREMIIVGDLHANKRNLKAILRDSGNLDKVRKNRAVIIFLGDIVHDERTGFLKEMESSIEILDVMIHLLNRYPSNIIYLIGNHDTLSPRLSKSGIQQGIVFRDTLAAHRGKKYAELVERLFDALPVFVKHSHFLAMHGGPVRGGIGRLELINIKTYPDCEHQLVWNRINETHSTPSMKEYSPESLDELRETLRCPANIPVVVGHNPMWKWGGNDSLWIDILRTHDHVILYSGAGAVCPYLVFRGSAVYEVKYADLRMKQKRFVLDND